MNSKPKISISTHEISPPKLRLEITPNQVAASANFAKKPSGALVGKDLKYFVEEADVQSTPIRQSQRSSRHKHHVDRESQCEIPKEDAVTQRVYMHQNDASINRTPKSEIS